MSFDITANQGSGIEDLNQGGSMPLLRILQDLSPQVRKQKDEYIEGAESGDIYFAADECILGKSIEIIPIKMKPLYTEWTPRDQGGGLVGLHPLTITDDARYEQGRNARYDEWLGDNELLMTHYWFVRVLVNGEWVEALIAMTKSQLKISRDLQKKIKNFRYDDHPDVQPNIFARKVVLESEYVENDNGDGYNNWKVGDFTVLDPSEDEALLVEANDLSKGAEQYLPAPEPQVALPDGFEDDDAVDI